MGEKLQIEGQEIAIKRVNDQDYISLTDMSNWDNSEYSRNRIANWLKNRGTLDFLTIWEQDNNPDFNYSQMQVIKNDAPQNAFTISPKAYIEKTQAIDSFLNLEDTGEPMHMLILLSNLALG